MGQPQPLGQPCCPPAVFTPLQCEVCASTFSYCWNPWDPRAGNDAWKTTMRSKLTCHWWMRDMISAALTPDWTLILLLSICLYYSQDTNWLPSWLKRKLKGSRQTILHFSTLALRDLHALGSKGIIYHLIFHSFCLSLPVFSCFPI